MSDEYEQGRRDAAQAILQERRTLQADGLSESLSHLMAECARIALGK